MTKMQSYKDFIKTAADGDTPWYNDVQNWMKKNPELTAGGTAALAGIPLYLLGRGFGKKRDRLLGLLTALVGGGAAYYGMKNWGVPWLAGLGQKETKPTISTTTTSTGFNPSSRVIPAKGKQSTQPKQKKQIESRPPLPVDTRLMASAGDYMVMREQANPVQKQEETPGGSRNDTYVHGLAQFRDAMVAKHGPVDKWSSDLMAHFKREGARFYQDPSYKMQVPDAPPMSPGDYNAFVENANRKEKAWDKVNRWMNQ